MEAALEVDSVATSPDDLMAKAVAEHSKTRKAMGKALAHARAAGDFLLQAQAAVKAMGARWGKWLESNCPIPTSTCTLYMDIAKSWSDLENLTDIETETVTGARAALTALRRRVKPTPSPTTIKPAKSDPVKSSALDMDDEDATTLPLGWMEKVESIIRAAEPEKVAADHRAEKLAHLRRLQAAITDMVAKLESDGGVE